MVLRVEVVLSPHPGTQDVLKAEKPHLSENEQYIYLRIKIIEFTKEKALSGRLFVYLYTCSGRLQPEHRYSTHTWEIQ